MTLATHDEPVFSDATTVTLAELATLFTGCYEGYPYPAATTAAQLAKRIREESIDLEASYVMRHEGHLCGLGLIARRGDETWCGGFGLTSEVRGRGLAHTLAAELVRRARATRSRRLRLEVLTGNAAARRTYERAGLSVVRTVLVFSWRRTPEAPHVVPQRSLRKVAVDELLFPSADPLVVSACWQRTPASLLARSGLEGIEQVAEDGARAWGIVAIVPPHAARLLALSSQSERSCRALIGALKERFLSIGVVNEPEDSPHVAALTAAGFTESDRQFEMAIDFTGPASAPASAG